MIIENTTECYANARPFAEIEPYVQLLPPEIGTATQEETLDHVREHGDAFGYGSVYDASKGTIEEASQAKLNRVLLALHAVALTVGTYSLTGQEAELLPYGLPTPLAETDSILPTPVLAGLCLLNLFNLSYRMQTILKRSNA